MEEMEVNDSALSGAPGPSQVRVMAGGEEVDIPEALLEDVREGVHLTM